MAYSWQCPYCSHHATITDNHDKIYSFSFLLNNKYGLQYVYSNVISCPNPECREYTLNVALFNSKEDRLGNNSPENYPKKTWQLIPAAEMKVFPNYIPKPIIADYEEACLIRDLSPKASATLARRCLQGMIRDFWGIKKKRLLDEINALQEKTDDITWSAIDSVRKIGNIGAHMEEDINLIIDVEPREAQLLIGLIETLIKEWYIAKHDKEQSMAAIITLAVEKDNIKQKKDS
ncbi:MAG: DUF4145 domain-containing protein [Syntrophales bacterium]|jgi:hypothetical protein